MAKRPKSRPAGKKESIYEQITNQIVARIRAGELPPWRQGYTPAGGVMGMRGVSMPHNAFSRRPYSGINLLQTLFACMDGGYKTPAFATFKQIKERGGNVKKGERGHTLVFYKKIDRDKTAGAGGDGHEGEDRDEDDRDYIMMARKYVVFNLDQTEGLEKYLDRYRPAESATEDDGIIVTAGTEEGVRSVDDQIMDLMEDRVRETGVTVTFKDETPMAYYRVSSHEVVVPNRERFVSLASYAATFLHEGAHSTMFELGRREKGLGAPRATKAYAQEELVAETSALFMAARLGLPLEMDNSATYLASYMDPKEMADALEDDPKVLFRAARLAQEATEYLVNEPVLRSVAQMRAGVADIDADSLYGLMTESGIELDDLQSVNVPAAVTLDPGADIDAALDAALDKIDAGAGNKPARAQIEEEAKDLAQSLDDAEREAGSKSAQVGLAGFFD